MPETERRLRLLILGGYLGAGKTTWLRHQLHTGALGRAHVLMNEAAEIPVDDAVLRGAPAVTVLAGGCACCAGLDGLLDALRSLCDARSRAGSDFPGRVVLETSGLADPAPIAAAIRADPVLARHILLDSVVVLVDPANGPGQLAADALGRRQIEAADRLVVTKPDGAPGLDRLRATLAALNPGAELAVAERGVERPADPVPPGTPPLPVAQSDAAPLDAVPVRLPPALDWAGFSVWLSALLHVRGDRIARVKGVLRAPSGRLLIQGVGRNVQPPEILPEPGAAADGTLVLIGRDLDARRLTASVGRLGGG